MELLTEKPVCKNRLLFVQNVKFFANKNKYPNVKVLQLETEAIYLKWQQHRVSWELQIKLLLLPFFC